MKTILLAVALVLMVLVVGYFDRPPKQELLQPNGYFRYVPEDKIHTMRVFEDGSFYIEYQDGTSEEGCVPNKLCND